MADLKEPDLPNETTQAETKDSLDGTENQNENSSSKAQETSGTEESTGLQEKAEVPESTDIQEEDEYLDILGNGTLLKKVLEKGAGSRPLMGEKVTIQLTKEIPEIEMSFPEEELTFILGDGDVEQALDLVCSLMNLGEKAQILAGYKYMYGDLGLKPDIPGKANFKLHVHLVSNDGQPDYSTMGFEKRFSEARKKKDRGNFLFKRKEHSQSLNSYTKASKIVDPANGCIYSDESPENLQVLLEFRAVVLCNTSAAQTKVQAYDAAIKSATEATKLSPSYSKAFFRLGQAYEKTGNVDEAIKAFKTSVKLDEGNKTLHAELSRLTKLRKQSKESEKQMYSKMFWGSKPPSVNTDSKVKDDASLNNAVNQPKPSDSALLNPSSTGHTAKPISQQPSTSQGFIFNEDMFAASQRAAQSTSHTAKPISLQPSTSQGFLFNADMFAAGQRPAQSTSHTAKPISPQPSTSLGFIFNADMFAAGQRPAQSTIHTAKPISPQPSTSLGFIFNADMFAAGQRAAQQQLAEGNSHPESLEVAYRFLEAVGWNGLDITKTELLMMADMMAGHMAALTRIPPEQREEFMEHSAFIFPKAEENVVKARSTAVEQYAVAVPKYEGSEVKDPRTVEEQQVPVFPMEAGGVNNSNAFMQQQAAGISKKESSEVKAKFEAILNMLQMTYIKNSETVAASGIFAASVYEMNLERTNEEQTAEVAVTSATSASIANARTSHQEVTKKLDKQIAKAAATSSAATICIANERKSHKEVIKNLEEEIVRVNSSTTAASVSLANARISHEKVITKLKEEIKGIRAILRTDYSEIRAEDKDTVTSVASAKIMNTEQARQVGMTDIVQKENEAMKAQVRRQKAPDKLNCVTSAKIINAEQTTKLDKIVKKENEVKTTSQKEEEIKALEGETDVDEAFRIVKKENEVKTTSQKEEEIKALESETDVDEAFRQRSASVMKKNKAAGQPKHSASASLNHSPISHTAKPIFPQPSTSQGFIFNNNMFAAGQQQHAEGMSHPESLAVETRVLQEMGCNEKEHTQTELFRLDDQMVLETVTTNQHALTFPEDEASELKALSTANAPSSTPRELKANILKHFNDKKATLSTVTSAASAKIMKAEKVTQAQKESEIQVHNTVTASAKMINSRKSCEEVNVNEKIRAQGNDTVSSKALANKVDSIKPDQVEEILKEENKVNTSAKKEKLEEIRALDGETDVDEVLRHRTATEMKKFTMLWKAGATVVGASLVGVLGIGVYRYVNH